MVVKIRVPFWGTLNNRCSIIFGTHIGTIILTTTLIKSSMLYGFSFKGAIKVVIRVGCSGFGLRGGFYESSRMEGFDEDSARFCQIRVV